MTIFARCCYFTVVGFLAVHFAFVKAPVVDRGVASETHVAKPWYDASFKY